MAQAALIWAALAAAICVPIAAAAASPSARMAGPDLHTGWIRRDHRTGYPDRSASADWRVLTGTVGLSFAAYTSLDRERAGRGGGGPRRGPLDHQSAGHDRCPSLNVADSVLRLWCDRDVGDLCCCAFGCTAPAIGTATANVAHRSYAPRCGHRRRECGPQSTDRGGDGDGVEGGPLRTGPRSDHKGHR